MAITKIHAVKVRLGDAINYIENPDKTDGQELISGYNTAPQTAVLDFSVTAAMARKARNASAKKQGNLAYHLIQSFSAYIGAVATLARSFSDTVSGK